MAKPISILLALIAATIVGQASAAFSAPTFKVVVHPDSPATTVDRKLLSEIYLKRVTRWADGDVIKPVDQARDSPVRRSFSESIVGRSIAAIKSYWQQQIFSGRDLPPPELDSDEAVIRYVLSHRGAIGYISANANPGGAKVLSLP